MTDKESNRGSLVLGFVGAILTVIFVYIGLPIAAIAFVCVMAMIIPSRLRPSIKIEQASFDQVILHQPKALRNSAVWLVAVFITMGVALFAQIVVGVDQAWRLMLPAVGCFFVAAVAALSAYRSRGPVQLDRHSLTLGNGDEYSLAHDRFEAFTPARSASSVRITRKDFQDQRRPAYIPCRLYGIDPNTLLSTLAQLNDWSRNGKAANGGQIAAMLAVPDQPSVALGDSVNVKLALPVIGC
ncbi:hypothetical protein [Williamsia sterculiae]|uniref:hypothetical protein n=1 Tax=Williamsia sterculiae TaxID=1344003 RepID=UPI0011800B93|nr:hypothetical protein [Williamsia sterculiae]